MKKIITFFLLLPIAVTSQKINSTSYTTILEIDKGSTTAYLELKSDKEDPFIYFACLRPNNGRITLPNGIVVIRLCEKINVDLLDGKISNVEYFAEDKYNNQIKSLEKLDLSSFYNVIYEKLSTN